jgi:hypothetical protein
VPAAAPLVTPIASERRPVAAPIASALAPKSDASRKHAATADARRPSGIETSKGGPVTATESNRTTLSPASATSIAQALSRKTRRRGTGVERRMSSVFCSSSPAIALAPAPIA